MAETEGTAGDGDVMIGTGGEIWKREGRARGTPRPVVPLTGAGWVLGYLHWLRCNWFWSSSSFIRPSCHPHPRSKRRPPRLTPSSTLVHASSTPTLPRLPIPVPPFQSATGHAQCFPPCPLTCLHCIFVPTNVSRP
jgi:hypothetical protein